MVLLVLAGISALVWSKLTEISKTPAAFDTAAVSRRAQVVEKNISCMPARRPGEHGRVNSYPASPLTQCGSWSIQNIFEVHAPLDFISWAAFPDTNNEVLLLGQTKGPIQILEVVTKGDIQHYQLRSAMPLKNLGTHSCRDDSKFCYAAYAKPIDSGFVVVDRHRVMQYDYSWMPLVANIAGLDAENPVERRIAIHGMYNSRDLNNGPFYPTSVARYSPFNSTHIDPTFQIHPRIMPLAVSELLLVTDTGNQRVLILNASAWGTLELIGQFGVTGEARHDETGFSSPWGIDVYAPAWESRLEPVFANVFVADRRNNRLVKLNLGHPLVPCRGSSLLEPAERCRFYSSVQLGYSGEYGGTADVLGTPQGLDDPVQVAVYRHYVFVVEARSSVVTVLQVDHESPDRFIFVTHFAPQRGKYLQGHMAISSYGYVWYDYMDSDLSYYLASFFLPEELRLSKKPDILEDYLQTCVNETWYEDLRFNSSLYMDHMGFILNASEINWVFPDEPDYLDIFSFNGSDGFDFQLLDRTVFNYTMETCRPPPPPTAIPILSGNDEGWATQQTEGRRNVAFQSRPLLYQLLALLRLTLIF